MASGDIVQRTSGSTTVLLLDSVGTGATNNGVWVECPDGYGMGTVVVNGATGATVVTVNALDDNPATPPPSAATVGAVIATATAGTNLFTSLPVLPRWSKCGITVIGTGTVTATLQARKVT